MPTHRIRARTAHGRIDHAAADRSPDRVAAHLEDAAHFPGGHAEAIARPETEADVAALLRTHSRVWPIGAQSSVTGGATPDGGVILSTDRFTLLDRVDDDIVRAGAGVPLSVLEEWLASFDRWFPPAPTFMGAFVGGVIATNAAGASTFKHGTTRDWISGITIVLACGCVLDVERGQVLGDGRHGFELECAHGTRSLTPGSYHLPAVPKCSAGYFTSQPMDLIDLFIGSEGTLGVITEARLRVKPSPPAAAMAFVWLANEADALRLTGELRQLARRTWQTRDDRGLDVAAVEYIDARSIAILREDGADVKSAVVLPRAAAAALFIHLELLATSTAAALYDEAARALEPDAPDTPIVRLCRLLAGFDALEAAELAMPGDRRRRDQLLAIREAVPAGVNRRIGAAKRDIDARIEKTAADMVVPFAHFAEMMRVYRDGFERRDLDYAIWGHFSDGNVHPNVIPRSYNDVVLGKEAILEFGREAARLGGSPLAEHGVGRSPVKQALLRQLYGDRAIDEMRAIKRVLDPGGTLAPGVLFAPAPIRL